MRDWDWRFAAMVAAVVAVAGGVVALIVWEVHNEATEPDAGWVTDKRYHPEYETESCYQSGNVPICTETEYDEWWEVRYCDDDGACGDDEVDWVEYQGIAVGDWYEQ